MSYFNDIFNPKIEAYEAGKAYKERAIVKYNGLFYICASAACVLCSTPSAMTI